MNKQRKPTKVPNLLFHAATTTEWMRCCATYACCSRGSPTSEAASDLVDASHRVGESGVLMLRGAVFYSIPIQCVTSLPPRRAHSLQRRRGLSVMPWPTSSRFATHEPLSRSNRHLVSSSPQGSELAQQIAIATGQRRGPGPNPHNVADIMRAVGARAYESA